jgi:hypothetical protein
MSDPRPSATYQCRLLVHDDPWTIEIEPAAFHRPRDGHSIADNLSIIGLNVEPREFPERKDVW